MLEYQRTFMTSLQVIPEEIVLQITVKDIHLRAGITR